MSSGSAVRTALAALTAQLSLVPVRDLAPAPATVAAGGWDTRAAKPARYLLHRTAPTWRAAMTTVPYAELHAHSYYSFADGADSPADLVAEAARLGLSAFAVTDHDGLYAVPELAAAAARPRLGDRVRR